MTPRAQRLLPVMGAIYVPPRAEELAAPLRILADHKLHISTPEQPQRIDRFDVRRVRGYVLWTFAFCPCVWFGSPPCVFGCQAIGVYFDKATVDDIMATFGQTPVRGCLCTQHPPASHGGMTLTHRGDVTCLQDVMRQAQEKQVQRNRAVQKEVLTSLRRITKVVSAVWGLRLGVLQLAVSHGCFGCTEAGPRR